MKQKEFVGLLTEVACIMGRVGGTFEFQKNVLLVCFKEKSLSLFTKPNIYLNLNMDEKNVWDYGTYMLNDEKVESFSYINSEKLTNLVNFIEGLVQSIIYEHEFDETVTRELSNRFNEFLEHRTRMNYLRYKNAGELFLKEKEFNKRKRKRINRLRKPLIDRLIEVKLQLLNSMISDYSSKEVIPWSNIHSDIGHRQETTNNQKRGVLRTFHKGQVSRNEGMHRSQVVHTF